jgi:hypothetical protein
LLYICLKRNQTKTLNKGVRGMAEKIKEDQKRWFGYGSSYRKGGGQDLGKQFLGDRFGCLSRTRRPKLQILAFGCRPVL